MDLIIYPFGILVAKVILYTSCNTPHPILTLLTTLINWERERKEREKRRKREEKPNRIQPDLWVRPGRFSHFRPPFQSRLVPNWSLRDEQRIHAILAAENRLESHRSKLWSYAESPPWFAVISPVSGEAITWVLFLTFPSAVSD